MQVLGGTESFATRRGLYSGVDGSGSVILHVSVGCIASDFNFMTSGGSGVRPRGHLEHPRSLDPGYLVNLGVNQAKQGIMKDLILVAREAGGEPGDEAIPVIIAVPGRKLSFVLAPVKDLLLRDILQATVEYARKGLAGHSIEVIFLGGPVPIRLPGFWVFFPQSDEMKRLVDQSNVSPFDLDR